MSDCHTIDCGYTVTGKVCNCSCGAADELVPSEAELKAIDLTKKLTHGRRRNERAYIDPKTNTAKWREKPPGEQASRCRPASGSEVWIKMNLRAYSMNAAIMFPVVVVMYAAWNIPPMPWTCGITTGLWLGMMHNVIWGMLVWQRPPNVEVSNGER